MSLFETSDLIGTNYKLFLSLQAKKIDVENLTIYVVEGVLLIARLLIKFCATYKYPYFPRLGRS